MQALVVRACIYDGPFCCFARNEVARMMVRDDDTEHDDMLKALTGMSDERLREIRLGAKIYLAIYNKAYQQALYPIEGK